MDEYRVDYPYIAPPFRQRPLESPFLEMRYQGTTPGHDNPAFRPMTKEERDEARRIAVEASFNFDGYQVVRREFAGSRFDPVLTIREKSITFNKACISKLDHVVYVQLLINPEKKTLAIRPCEEGARDAIRWCIPKDDDRKSREIRCDIFTAKVYEMMGWQTFYHYKLQGMRIDYRGEQLYVFDLKNTYNYIPGKKDPDNPDSRPRRGKIVFPLEWRDSFGLPIVEHTAATQVNLLDGYGFVEGDPTKEEQEVFENE